MKKSEAIFTTIVVMTIFYCGIGYKVIQGYLKDIGNLRGSIVEARQLLSSSDKKQIEYAKTILDNAQYSLERSKE